MNATENLLTQQLKQSRDSEKLYKQTIKNMARASLKQLPREMLIEVLVKKKIIKRDWLEKGVKYKLT